MSGAFLITGLPRSRTAWLSVAATTAVSLCVHEPSVYWPRWQRIYAYFDNARAVGKHQGVSDSLYSLHLPALMADGFDGRVLVVERPINDVMKSLAAKNIPVKRRLLELMQAGMDAVRGEDGVKFVRYAALNDPAVVCECIRHLIPEAMPSQIDYRRVWFLENLHIETNIARMMQLAKERSQYGRDLLGESVVLELTK